MKRIFHIKRADDLDELWLEDTDIYHRYYDTDNPPYEFSVKRINHIELITLLLRIGAEEHAERILAEIEKAREQADARITAIVENSRPKPPPEPDIEPARPVTIYRFTVRHRNEIGTVYSTPVGSVKLRARVEELGGEVLSVDDEQWSVAELRHHALRAFNKANGTAYLVEDPDENNDNPLCLLDHDYYRD